ncbi:MAG TPA: iron-sulfur cluster repair di-iron protein [Gaiellaceae bacterium]|nr:iron-sulfur cluster repair di-iron protein [Gaiellaceae bacterium]
MDVTTTVAELVAERPGRARVLERLGIDYCCGGKVPLRDAVAGKGLDPSTVLVLLEAIDDAVAAGRDWREASLSELCDHIVREHHAYLRDELPRLAALAEKVERAHGGEHPELRDVRATLGALTIELTGHLQTEERLVFPALRRLGAGGELEPAQLDGALAVLEQEHDEAGVALARLRELTGGFVPPAGACNSFRAFYAGLADLERDLHEHVHEENNVLFPRAAALVHVERKSGRRPPANFRRAG